MNFKKNFLFTGLMALLWFVILGLMIKNYLDYPPLPAENPLSERIGNIEGSIYLYGFFTFAELLTGILLVHNFFRFSRSLRIILLIIPIGITVAAYVDAMFKGGVPAGHAIWLTVESFMIYTFLAYAFFLRRRKNG
jgi:hypothetical protein